MSVYLRNKTTNYAWILGRRVSPGSQLDLEKIFIGYCEPKVSSRVELKKLESVKNKKGVSIPTEFTRDEFDLFMDWVENELAIDRATWEILQNNSSLNARVDGPKKKKQVQQVLSLSKQKKVAKRNDLSSREIAWLPYNDETKEIISNISAKNVRELKAAFRLVRNLSGQEKTRKLIEQRILELASEGIV